MVVRVWMRVRRGDRMQLEVMLLGVVEREDVVENDQGAVPV